MYHPFSIIETLKTSWNILRKNFIPLVIYSVISLIIYKAVDIAIFLFFDESEEILSGLVQFFLQAIIQSYLTLSFYKLILTLMDREYYEFEFKDILPSLRMALNFILIGILFGVLICILVFINLVLQRQDEFYSEIFQVVAVIGLLYLLLRSVLCVCFIVDDDSTPFESLKQSFEITKDNFLKTLGIVFSIFAIMLLTLIPINAIITFLQPEDGDDYLFLIGYYAWFAIAFPAVQVIIMVTYRKLVYSHMDIDDNVAETD
ncbi:hypothetical protein LT679_06000 [Mucilaginibacter roseus]|uniref:Glycerophosphoryl diester phosphodiesterase membrane domain-containing protein n=1 Tax=Mucilaginibacter roseus TaxID=1528868 RepID=A0ABS8TZ54_9SPHI|nr:hypothetical protein [Mucilaginibacter roseus]MCD8740149.1 hypothetical protein [Mucilaginibacter roseus]